MYVELKVTATHKIKPSKVNDKEIILKIATEERGCIQGSPPKIIGGFLNELFRPEENGMMYSKY